MILKTYISVQLFLAAWAATVPTSTVPGIFNFTSLMDMVVNISSSTEAPPSNVTEITPEQTCQLRKIAKCFSATAPIFYTAVMNIYRRDTRLSICGIADNFDTCTVPYKQQCTSSDTLSFDIFTGLIQYLCTEQGYTDYLSFVPCLSNKYVTSEINKCVDRFPFPLAWDDLCRLPDNYTSCVINATRSYCDETSAKMLRQTLMTILYPLKIATCPNRPSPTDNTERAFAGTHFTTGVNTILEIQPSLSAEPTSSLEIAFASVESSAPTSIFSEGFATRAPDVESISAFSEDLATRARDVAFTRVISEDFATRSSDFITSEESSSTVLPVVQSSVLETSTLLPDIQLMTRDVSTLDKAFVTPQALVDEASASLTEFPGLHTFSQDLTTTAIELIASQINQEVTSSTFQRLQVESVTIASQMLQGESLTVASQVLQEESVTIATQILQEETVTRATQILEEVSVTIAPELLSEEFSTITPYGTTPLTFEFSTTKLDTQTLEDTFLTLVPSVSKSKTLSEETLKVALDMQASSLDMSTILPHMTPHLSLEKVTLTTSDTSTITESTQAVTTDATEVLTEGFFIQTTIGVKQNEASLEQELSTRITNLDQTGLLSTSITDAAATTSSSQEMLTILQDNSVTATSTQEFLVFGSTSASLEFSTATLPTTDKTTSSQEFSKTTTDILTSIIPVIELASEAGMQPSKSTDGFSTTPFETSSVQTSLKELLTTSLETTRVLSSGEFSTIYPEDRAGQVSLVPGVISSQEYVGIVSTTPLESTPIVASLGIFSTVPLIVTAVKMSLEELSTVSFEITAVQDSQREFSTAALEVAPSEIISTQNLMTELPRVNTSQKVSDGVSTLLLQMSTAKTLSEEPSITTVGGVASSLVVEDGTLSTIVPRATAILSSIDAISTGMQDNGALEASTELLSTSVLEIFASETSLELFPTVALNIETSQMSMGDFPTQSADVTATETPIDRFATSGADIRTTRKSSGEFVTEIIFATVTRIPQVQFSTVILESKVSQQEFLSTAVADISVEGLSSISTIMPDVTAIETSATVTPSITILQESSSIIDLSTSAPERNTISTDGITISTTEISTTGQEISTNLQVSTITKEYTPSAQEISTIVIDGTTIYPSLDTLATIGLQESSTQQTTFIEGTSIAQGMSTIVIDGTTIYPSLDTVATIGLQESSTEQTTLIEGTSIAVRDLTIPSLSFDAFSITTQEVQISPTSVEFLSTATADATTSQTPSQEVTTISSVTTTASTATTTFPPTTSPDFQASPLNCYECHSGAPGSWQNVNCPANGRIQSWAATPRLCHGPCVSIVSKFPAGDVYRACSTNYYFPTAPPLNGCIRQEEGLFCFCSTHFCNARAMVTEQQEYVKGTNV